MRKEVMMMMNPMLDIGLMILSMTGTGIGGTNTTTSYLRG